MKCSLLLYTAIIRPLIAYACPVWAAASKKKIKKLQTLQNKCLRISLKAPWFMRNKQLHNDTGLPYLSTWITQQFKNFHEKLNKADGALHYKIGRRSTNLRLKPRLPQNILLDSKENT
ncbi:ribosome biogenesis protein TSR3 isoform X1 [Aphis craccivora]|uniref:Ribosome biogenesis protein TSR3 isoform X1 n=1 Tax=Aphis craccivora TaxID=307492 RepID=A0A6G0ZHB0_APHCR|nr:ribosome biogenesis protein TSR3 isoform X1 [Aphis craccivora]